MPHAATSAAVARRRCTEELRLRGVPDRVVDDVALVLSELVGNAIRHGQPLTGGGIRVAWEVVGQPADGIVHLEVYDGGDGPGRADLSPDLSGGSSDDERGRGLSIVALLASTWGSRIGAESALMWADLAAQGQPAVEDADDWLLEA